MKAATAEKKVGRVVIRLNVDLATTRAHYAKGSVTEWDKADAERLVKANFASYVQNDEPEKD